MDVPDEAYLTDETNLVQVVGHDKDGKLVCEDVSGPVDEVPSPILLEPGRVRPASAPPVSGRWRLVNRAVDRSAAA